jgi:hypothetical protein
MEFEDDEPEDEDEALADPSQTEPEPDAVLVDIPCTRGMRMWRYHRFVNHVCVQCGLMARDD